MTNIQEEGILRLRGGGCFAWLRRRGHADYSIPSTNIPETHIQSVKPPFRTKPKAKPAYTSGNYYNHNNRAQDTYTAGGYAGTPYIPIVVPSGDTGGHGHGHGHGCDTGGIGSGIGGGHGHTGGHDSGGGSGGWGGGGGDSGGGSSGGGGGGDSGGGGGGGCGGGGGGC